MRISDWSSDVCSSDLLRRHHALRNLELKVFSTKQALLCDLGLDVGRQSGALLDPQGQLCAPTVELDGPHCADCHVIDLDLGVRHEVDGIFHVDRDPHVIVSSPLGEGQGLVVHASELATAHCAAQNEGRSEEHTSELQSLMRISYAVFCLKKKKLHNT